MSFPIALEITLEINTNMTVLGGLKDKSLGCCVALAK